MRKYLIILILFSSLAFSYKFSDVEQKYYITISELKKNKEKLELGDVVIFKPKKKDSIFNFGHLAIIGKNHKLVDFPWVPPKYGFREVPIDLLETYESDREVLVIRYKYMTAEFKERLAKNIYGSINKRYNIYVPRDINDSLTYCTKFVYDVYEDSNLDSSETIFPVKTQFILPVEFLGAGKNFYILEFN